MTLFAERALDLMHLTDEEKTLTQDMPSDVTFGYVKAKRKHEGQPKRDKANFDFGGLFG